MEATERGDGNDDAPDEVAANLEDRLKNRLDDTLENAGWHLA
jgi:hypothetical protein